jgi:hypothetical protein
MSGCPSHSPAAASSASGRGERAECRPPEILPERYRRWRESALGTLTETVESPVVLRAVGDVEPSDCWTWDAVTEGMRSRSPGKALVGADLAR